MAARIRAFDWSASSLGPSDAWPSGLRTAVEISLDSAFPTFIWWGPELIEFHNDAAIAILQSKHPGALGRPAREVWAEIWHAVGPLAAGVLRTGEPFTDEGLRLTLERGGPPEDAYFTFCYSALRDENGDIAGMQAVAIETTAAARAAAAQQQAQAALRASESRQAFLLALADRLRPIADPVEVMAAASEELGIHLGVGRCGYGEVDATGEFFVVERDWTDGVMASLRGTLRLDDFGPEFISSFRAGHTVVLDDALADSRARGVEAAFDAIGGLRASLAVPLLKAGRWVAVFYAQQAQPRRWTPDEEALVEEVAERTWAAVEQARAEAALRASEERYRTLFTSIDEGFVVIEVLFDTNDKPYDCLVLENNPSFDRMMRATDMVGKTALEIFPDAEDSWFEAYGRVVATGEAIRFENYLGPLDAWFELYISRVGGDGSRRAAIVFNDITDRKRAEAALRESEATLQERVAAATTELQALSHRLLTIQEEERRSLARELHDEIGQSLTGLNFTLAMARRGETGVANDHLERAQAISHDLLEQVRQLSLDLRPAVLDDLGLEPALVAHAERFTDRTGVRVDLRYQGNDQRFPADIETAAYRVVQEALTNVARHAGVDTASVHVLVDGTLTLWVSDAGRGFDPEVVRSRGTSSGLTGIAERALLAGGTFEIDSVPDEGTTLIVEFPGEPVRRRSEEDAP